uniref:Papilin a, proteoglycan-like sulfated glycoprotein n=1 Tax=Oryzias melastigma TaxID=30732 RepID=A0A3B3DZ05_ORYME
MFCLQVPSMDSWDSWGPYGECSRSCGGGVTTRSRRCITHRTDGGHNCVGPDKSYRSCNIQDCPEGSRDFREEQCSQFDGTNFQGKRYKWLPYYGADNPCELNCMPRGENFYYRHRSAVVDGTPCHPGRRDICVGGVCKRLGCDNMLESPLQEDPCLQCGGNGQSCHLVKHRFTVRDLPTGYNQVFILPVGATSISIREMTATRNYLGTFLFRQTSLHLLNFHLCLLFLVWLFNKKPFLELKPNICSFWFSSQLISQEPNQGVEYEYYLPNGRSREGYYWSFGSWSACSKECGSGYQSRLVFCTIDNESYPDYLCASLPRPQSNRTCNPQPCPQTRSWTVGDWNACSVTCGGGSQTRSVQCVSHDGAGPRVVEDALCAAYTEAPPSLQTCNMQKCADSDDACAWLQCSVSCGSGEQTRTVTCVGSDGLTLQDSSCRALLRPPAVQPCEMPACPRQIRWHVGPWGLCSKSCGSGSRERQVICSDQERNLYPVDQCGAQPRPSTMERCNRQPCNSPQGLLIISTLQIIMQIVFKFHEYKLSWLQLDADVCVLSLLAARRRDPAQTNTIHDPHSSAPALHCSQSFYGCCPDRRTAASAPRGQGCPRAPTPTPGPEYGCCRDGLTAAQGPRRQGCMESVAPAPTVNMFLHQAASLPTQNAPGCKLTTYGCCYDRTTPAGGPNGEGCPDPPNNSKYRRNRVDIFGHVCVSSRDQGLKILDFSDVMRSLIRRHVVSKVTVLRSKFFKCKQNAEF